MSTFVVEKIHPAAIDNKVNKYVYKMREKYVGGSNNLFSRLKLHNQEEPTENTVTQVETNIESNIESNNNADNKVDNKNDNGSRFYYLSALTSLGIQFGTIVYWYLRS